MRRHFIYTLWGIFAAGIVSVALAFMAIWFGWIGYMPDIEDLQNPISRFATQVYLSLIHISEPTRLLSASRMPSSA